MTTVMSHVPTNSRRPLRIGLSVLLMGLGGFLVWSLTAPLDEGVPLQGQVAVQGNRKAIQHLQGGIVTEIAVQDGDRVQAGQTLIRLDTARLLGEVQVIRSQLSALVARTSGLNMQVPLHRSQIQSLQGDLEQLKPLVDEDLYPRNRYHEQARQLTQLQLQLRQDMTELQQGLAQVGELRQREALLQTDLIRTEITAPSAGVVLGLTVHTPGAVIPPGGKIMELVPASDRLIIEARVPPHLIESVRPGLPAQLRFSALNPRTTPVIHGEVSLVSADLLTTEKGDSFYTARLVASASELARLGQVTLQPGMPVEAVVVTGERSFYNYLMKPLGDRMALGLKER